jgi:hypothetical protein
MAEDRYLKGVLTIIAGALVYLCLASTEWPAAAAQTKPPLVRPGDNVGPIPVVVVGWRAPEPVSTAVQNTVQATVQNAVQVTGRVVTERSAGTADRVVLVGWEEQSDPLRGKDFRPFDTSGSRGLPTLAIPR